MVKTMLTKVTRMTDCGANKNSMIILVMRMMVETIDRDNGDDGVATAESDCNGTVISSPPTKTRWLFSMNLAIPLPVFAVPLASHQPYQSALFFP